MSAAHDRDRRGVGPAVSLVLLLSSASLLWVSDPSPAKIYVRVKVLEPAAAVRVTVGGFGHAGPTWWFDKIQVDLESGSWSEWTDVSRWPLHGRLNRAGGLAEWPTMKLTVGWRPARAPIQGTALEIELADAPDEAAVVHRFTERSASNSVAFLLPHPLREYKREFETGSAMTARHLAWAKEVTGGTSLRSKHFDVATTIWNHYDPALAATDVRTLGLLGFSIVNQAPAAVLREAAMKVIGKTWVYRADPEDVRQRWTRYVEEQLPRRFGRRNTEEDSEWLFANMDHLEIHDETMALSFKDVDPARTMAWFAEYLRAHRVSDADIGHPVGQTPYPIDLVEAKLPPTGADVATRRLFYYGAKFRQWWSAQRMRQTADLAKETLNGLRSSTMPSSHAFFGGWGPPHLGMSAATLDLFELGAQRSVDILSSEDWLGLNHMYGPGYTWTGAQSFEYLNALLRSAAGRQSIPLLSLITPSDDRYLNLKAYSSLAQGAKSFFFWTYGPTYIGTENYWSDLRSEYEGIARFMRALRKAENVLYPAAPVRDPVAILYSVSHDLWHADDPAAFVETRLTWHALRHLGVQPDFVREEEVEAGRLRDYKVVFFSGQCLTRAAAAALDAWVKGGGVLYLSAGAATRDEFYQPFIPPFGTAVWPADAAGKIVKQKHRYNERTDLPAIRPITTVTISAGATSARIPVIGYRLDLRPPAAGQLIATFENGAAAGVVSGYGKGRVIALGFLPMLAYGQLANFKPETLEERWRPEPRALVKLALEAARVTPVATPSVPVVEASLLTGPAGSVLVLVNYTYEPIADLRVDLRLPNLTASAQSIEGSRVIARQTPEGVQLELPLKWTDLILLPAAR
ncbi:MAG: hypothetical protein HYX76_14360 [Acidobacteria bacterium]|nr:hypothetical protein [Acidobacteriota bacterium]